MKKTPNKYINIETYNTINNSSSKKRFITGNRLTSKKKNYFVHVPVVVISGVEDQNILNKARSYPIIEILQKPFNERDIKYCVEKCLALYF